MKKETEQPVLGSQKKERKKLVWYPNRRRLSQNEREKFLFYQKPIIQIFLAFCPILDEDCFMEYYTFGRIFLPGRASVPEFMQVNGPTGNLIKAEEDTDNFRVLRKHIAIGMSYIFGKNLSLDLVEYLLRNKK